MSSTFSSILQYVQHSMYVCMVCILQLMNLEKLWNLNTVPAAAQENKLLSMEKYLKKK